MNITISILVLALTPALLSRGENYSATPIHATNYVWHSDSSYVRTSAERELAEVLSRNEIDLGLVNWLIAADLPEFAGLEREGYFKQLDAVTEQVRQTIKRMEQVAIARGESPASPRTRCAIFCNAIIKLQFAYADEFRLERITPEQMKALYANPDNIFLAGLLRTKRGSCVSMPLVYLAIGQRLGLPLHLVCIGRHYFIRWEEPGFRMNIETTIVDRVSVSPDDQVYLEIEGLPQDKLQGSELRNLTAKEVVGNLLFARSGYWAVHGSAGRASQLRDLAWARALAPDDPGIRKAYDSALSGRHETVTHGSETK